ncbi:homocysteine S-methyltransferase family protein [Oscillospiraceae bacterium MB08-C2-2]|nr:homocysteine S-methyltransferase family protein [Oscillospiraceae bacterium MB08-C2-2]
MDIVSLIREHIAVFDGGMGTMLQQRGLLVGDLPEVYNITHPEIVMGIHRDYVKAGAQIITANTFQANEYKLHCEYSVEDVIEAGIRNGREAGAPFVALDIGPLGQLMEPMGTVSFEEAYEVFKRQMVCGEKCGADLILMETFSDPYEAKAAILAAKESTSLPVICTLTYQEDGRTFVGCDPITATLTLQSLGVDALGVNCSLGPKEMLPVVEQILTYAKVPVIVQANAGLPVMQGDETVYVITPQEFAHYVAEMVKMGVRLVGGCCGTTPDFIREVVANIAGLSPVPTAPKKVTALTSGTKTVMLDDKITVIGERINPTGKPKMKAALRENRLEYIVGEAIDQEAAGSEILDINVGLPEIDEPAVMRSVIREVQGTMGLPLQIDSSDPAAIETGVRFCNGRPLINSVNGKAESMASIFPIVKKYGALVLGLALDEKGIPSTAEGRLAVARHIVETAESYGIPREDVLIDCLVLTASAQQAQVMETLKAIKLVKQELGVKTVLGVSNVSFGLPNRESLNATFLAAAFGAGLDAPILNPLSTRYMEVVRCFRVLDNEDSGAEDYIASQPDQTAPSPTSTGTDSGESRSLKDIIIQGRKDESAPRVTEMLATMAPLDIVNGHFIPALDTVGQRFEKGQLFLPQLMQSAEAVKKAFSIIKAHLESSGTKPESKGKILIATVKGDIHDIGKNIVKMILENYGYDVIDLGKDVPIETVVDTIRKEDIKLVGLSALMTTTVKNMKETIAAVKDAGLSCTFIVGGAVLNPEYASFVGADYYARDAMESVTIANRFFGVNN